MRNITRCSRLKLFGLMLEEEHRCRLCRQVWYCIHVPLQPTPDGSGTQVGLPPKSYCAKIGLSLVFALGWTSRSGQRVVDVVGPASMQPGGWRVSRRPLGRAASSSGKFVLKHLFPQGQMWRALMRARMLEVQCCWSSGSLSEMGCQHAVRARQPFARRCALCSVQPVSSQLQVAFTSAA